ncbi:hypothetical protein M1H70_17350 [Clostridioides difficile]|nr:hypothetical protein [Clostridioides difficile]
MENFLDNKNMLYALKMISPGTPLRLGLNNVLRAKTGGLIVIATNEDVMKIVDVGLTGEVRAVSFIEKRIAECKKLGFKKIVVPRSNYDVVKETKGIEIWPVDNLRQAINIVLGRNQ